MPKRTTIRKILILYEESDSYCAEIVRAAFCRSFTAHQVAITSYERSTGSAWCTVLINPSDRAAPLVQQVLRSGGKADSPGNHSSPDSRHFGSSHSRSCRMTSDLAEAPLNEEEPYNLSPARVIYRGDHPVAVAAAISNRPLCRYDFIDEWNNLGYGRILAGASPWGVAVTAECLDATCLAWIEDQSAQVLSAYTVLLESADGAALWINRSVGPVDSVEWGMVESFVGSYRCSDLTSLPYLREIPLDCAAAVTMRLDCDQAVASARRVFDLYSSRELPLSMAVATGVPMASDDLALLHDIVAKGGSVVSHSVNHHPAWGGSYEIALQEALDSREWIAKYVRETQYAVSPFHQNPVHAADALADAGYRGFVGGSIRDDPEFLIGRAGRVPFAKRPIVSHSQQCMLHGDCYHRYGNTITPYKESFELHVRAGSFFGYLDHPFSREYQYGWLTEEERLAVHEELIDHILSVDGTWWCSLQQCLDFLVQRDSCSLFVDEAGKVRFRYDEFLSDRKPAAMWKGEILAPQ